MSVEPSELISEAWTQWQGHVVNGAFPLRRYLGSSDHSAIFLTELAARQPSTAALKLIPAATGVEDPHLADWRTNAGLAHSHVIRLLESGRCELDGMAYLYAVMEYADQSLADVLRKRALTEDEAREMLLPTLHALAFLHNGNLVQGRLKPSNVLAVGDQLKVASDTVRRIGQARPSTYAASIYDPPETWQEGYSAAADIWALGVTLFEALTRGLPSGLDERRGVVPLPADFPAAFREIVAACLSRRPFDRPKVPEIEAWLHRPSGEAYKPPSAPQPVPREPAPREEIPRQATARAPASGKPASSQPASREPAAQERAPREAPSREAVSRAPAPPESTSREPARQEPARQEPARHEPALRELALREVALRESIAQEPVTHQPAVPAPTVAEPVLASTPAPSSPWPQRAMSQGHLAESARELAQRLAAYAGVIRDTLAQLLSKAPPLLSKGRLQLSKGLLVGKGLLLSKGQLLLSQGRLLLSKGRAFAPVIVGVALALAWMGIHSLTSHRKPAAPSVQAPQAAPPQAPGVAPRVAPAPPPPRVATSTKAGSIARPTPVKARSPTSAMHQELPNVPQSARRTIRGHIKVYVRVMVDPDGTVYAALADRAGPSRYFEKLSIEAAKKWTFPPVDTDAQRLVQVRFDFSRGGTTAQAVTLK